MDTDDRIRAVPPGANDQPKADVVITAAVLEVPKPAARKKSAKVR
jgi:hypothetical protein